MQVCHKDAHSLFRIKVTREERDAGARIHGSLLTRDSSERAQVRVALYTED